MTDRAITPTLDSHFVYNGDWYPIKLKVKVVNGKPVSGTWGVSNGD